MATATERNLMKHINRQMRLHGKVGAV